MYSLLIVNWWSTRYSLISITFSLTDGRVLEAPLHVVVAVGKLGISPLVTH